MNNFQTVVINELGYRRANLVAQRDHLATYRNLLAACREAIRVSDDIIAGSEEGMRHVSSEGASVYLRLQIDTAEMRKHQCENEIEGFVKQIATAEKQVADLEVIIADLEGLLTPDVASVL